MESYIIFFIFAIVIVGIMALLGAKERRKSRAFFRKQLIENYGKFPTKEYSPEQWETISKFYTKHPVFGQIDDITANDLELQDIYEAINHTQSAAGAEFLYYLLRTPALSFKELPFTEEQLCYFDSHEEERIQVQTDLYALGNTGKYSLYDYLDYLDDLGKRSNRMHFLSILLPLISLGIMFVSTEVGIVLLIGTLCFNLITYFKERREIEPYIVSFKYLLRLMDSSKSLIQQQIPILSNETEQLSKLRKEFSSFERGASLLMHDNAGMGGNPLDIVIDYLRILFHLDLIKFNSMLSVVREHTKEIDEMIRIVGSIDTMISITCFRASLPYYTIPILHEEKVPYQGKEMYHVLIPNAVSNDLEAKQCILLTGSNASGKSTFLKSCALCALLSQTIHTAPAKQYEASFYQIFSSMALRDNLLGGESYFIVEIKSLKRILDAANKASLEENRSYQTLCFIDEVLRGTNTVERISASTEILLALYRAGVCCFAATHDIELTTLLAQCYDNYHFTETMEDGDIKFSYKLLDGKANSRNAIRLLEAIGFKEDLIAQAEKRAEIFMETGEWQ